jgi:hypothetical protein
MTATVKTIPTRYKGYHFRSRLRFEHGESGAT